MNGRRSLDAGPLAPLQQIVSLARHTSPIPPSPILALTECTSEVLVIKAGRCVIDIYDDGKQLIASRELRVGDVVLMVGGGHGFRMLEDTVLLEIKQGPYTDLDEKERF